MAAHAGVSLATASRALNGSSRRVNAELYERVLASARTLKYSTNVQAQAVARGASNLVALVVGDDSIRWAHAAGAALARGFVPRAGGGARPSRRR
ncbi:LacI family DNA-binding transcriptional regulator [Leifsonia sp. 2MCAF36]|uniref:LacI family DNA-binding transcriptional regulator n=1 Tax=Leifsonia sp. 2MCAF36 TaxID=3232988 RepID=UPI003F95E0CD